MDGQKIVDAYFKLRFSIFFLLTFAAVFSFVIIPVYGADPFDEFVFQGVLKDSGGALVTATKDITLKIYTVLSGGTSLWEEEHNDVSVSNGIFTIFAGSVNSFANDLNFTNAYFLEIRIEDSNGNNPEILSPRIKIGGSPFSLSSARASVDFDLNKKNVINATSLNATSLEIDQTGSSLAANITNAGTGDSFRVNDAASDTSPFLIDNSGNVGIGTTSPTEKLHLNDGTFLQTPGNPTVAGSVSSSVNMNNAERVDVVGKYAYVTALASDSLTIIDISDPSNPTIEGNLKESTFLNGATGVFVNGKYAYVTTQDRNSLAIVNVSNSSSPKFEGEVTGISTPIDVYVSGKYAYVPASGTDRLHVIDISDPSNPTTVGTVTDSTFMDFPFGIFVSGSFAYVASFFSDSLAIINISDPSDPVVVSGLIDSTNMNSASNVYVSGKYAYVTGFLSDSLAIINISDPSDPILVGSLLNNKLNGASGVKVAGKYAYVSAENSDGIAIVDVSDPSSPTLVGSISSSGNMDGANGIDISGKYAYVSALTSDSLTVLDISGIDSHAASIGTIAASTIDVSENAQVGNDLYVGNGLVVGSGGIVSDGSVSFDNGTLITDGSGNVGIGTTTPGENLEIEVSDTSDPAITFDSDGNEFTIGIDSSDGDKFKISDSTALGTTDRIIIDSSGRVGIGTATPGTTLDVKSTISLVGPGSGSEGGQINLADPDQTTGSQTNSWSIDNFADDLRMFYNGGEVALFIESTNNNVGIGTTSPLAELHVSGDSFISGFVNATSLEIDQTGSSLAANITNTGSGDSFRVNDAPADTTPFLIDNSGNVGIGTTSPGENLEIEVSDTSDPAITFDSDGNEFTIGIDSSDGDKFKISDSTALGTTDRIIIDSSGRVGIGDTTPSQALEVTGNIKLSDGAGRIIFGPSDGEFNIIAGGNNILDLNDGQGGSVRLFVNNDGASLKLIIFDLAVSSNNNLVLFHDGSLGRIETSNTADPLILQSTGGSVGIGTTSPLAELHVSGDSFISGFVNATSLEIDQTGSSLAANITNAGSGDSFRVNDAPADTTPFLIDASGNVGIGTSTPAQELQVVGDINMQVNEAATTNGLCHSGADLDAASSNQINIVVCSDAPGDIAEWYEAIQGVTPGDIVVLTDEYIEFERDIFDPRTGTNTNEKMHERISIVTKATSENKEALFGVVSTSPWKTIGRGVLTIAENPQPVALIGRVPVNVSLEGGEINVGDRITISSKAGIGMKATSNVPTIGIALEPYTAESSGEMINILVENRHPVAYKDDVIEKLQVAIKRLKAEMDSLEEIICNDHPDADVCK